jgi:general secretion pathway protein G
MKQIKKGVQSGFSLIEILIVVTIISLLVSIAAVSYGSFVKQSRDAKRKTDIEQVRAAIEMYKSFNNVYPTPDVSGSNNGMPFGSGGISDATSTYLSKLPLDPKTSSGYTYFYTTANNNLDYTVCAYLEGGGTTVANTTCITGASPQCNYCMGPYGQE